MDFTILSGTANLPLGSAIARELEVPLGECAIGRYPDGEVSVELREPVRQRHVFIVQPTDPPVDERLIELLALADACRRSGAGSITAVVPYFGYARSDKRHGRQEPIMASLTADLMQTAGIRQVLTVDLHTPQIEGFFRIPVDSLTAVPVLSAALSTVVPAGTLVVSPDAGRVRMASEYAGRLGTSIVILHKRRETGADTTVTHIVGDVRDRSCLIVDDMITTAGTIIDSVEALVGAGARSDITVAATHGVLLEGAQERLARTPIRQLFITDTISRPMRPWPDLHVISVAPLIASVIRVCLSGAPQRELRDVLR